MLTCGVSGVGGALAADVDMWDEWRRWSLSG